jgi:hypothetical protein
MSYTRFLKKFIPSIHTADADILALGSLSLNVFAYLNRKNEDNDPQQIDLINTLSIIIASAHSLATYFKICSNHIRAGQHQSSLLRYKIGIGTTVIASAGSLVAACITDHSEASLSCSLANAGFNIGSRFFSMLRKEAVRDELQIRFDEPCMTNGADDSPSGNFHAMDNTI